MIGTNRVKCCANILTQWREVCWKHNLIFLSNWRSNSTSRRPNSCSQSFRSDFLSFIQWSDSFSYYFLSLPRCQLFMQVDIREELIAIFSLNLGKHLSEIIAEGGVIECSLRFDNYLSVLKIWNTTLTYHHCTMEIWKVAPKSRDPVISQAVWSVWQFSRCSIMQAAISITTTANRRSEDQSIAQRWRRDHSDFHREWITVSADRSHFLARKIIFFVLILMTSRK